MKQSYIGSYRPADGREHFDRTQGRGAPNDFIIRVKDEQIDSITPELSEDVRKKVVMVLACVMEGKAKLHTVAVIDDISVQIYNVINF
jgi:hypothetical protein